jgi:hypothetical protein
MADMSRAWVGVFVVASILIAGCAPEKKPEAPVVKIGAGSPAPPAAAPANQAPQAAVAVTADAPRTDVAPKRRTREADSPGIDDEDLGAGQKRFAVMTPTAIGGIHFVVAGEDPETSVDRFTYLPKDPRIDSTRFLASLQHDPDESPIELRIKDESAVAYELPAKFTPVESAGRSAAGLPWRIICEEDGAVMALVPEGVFMQGTKFGEPNSGPEHAVLLDAFYIDIHEVTYARYEKFRSATSEKRRIPRPARAEKDSQEPALGVAWAEAHAFALWAGKELPTESQWEKAARGPAGYRFPWGDGVAVWHRLRVPGQIDRVGSFRGDESPYGVIDLAGNAREWCSDWYSDQYYTQMGSESGSIARNPTGPKSSGSSNMRVVKGGDPRWAVWARTGVVQTDRLTDVGFRCVLKLKPADNSSSAKEKKKGSR